MTATPNDNDDRNQLLVTAVLQLSMARTIDQVGDIVRAVARKLTGAQGATFILREDEQCYYANEDAIAPLWKGRRFPMEACISGWVMLNKTHAVIPDIYEDQRIPHEAYRPTFVKSLVMVPIRKEDPLGAIGNYWSSNVIADQQTLKVLQALADITAVSIENINVYNELEKRVQDRTTQLEQSNERLRRANDELQTITYALSHDLKAPLRSINFHLWKLMKEIDDHVDAGTKEYGDKILKKVTNAQNLIDELLTLFKTSNKDLAIQDVDMQQLAREVAWDYKDTLPENVSIAIAELPIIAGDKILLKHVWANLISNAVKYSSRREKPDIRIGFEEKDKSVVYCVEDNGVGFDMNEAAELFKPFTRFHLPNEYEGAGIGLSVVERIVSRHGGRLWAKSAVDKGTTIFFELPRFN
ncbi:MAG: ATP-binding protein [Bacteroidota bacterium]